MSNHFPKSSQDARDPENQRPKDEEFSPLGVDLVASIPKQSIKINQDVSEGGDGRDYSVGATGIMQRAIVCAGDRSLLHNIGQY